MIGSARHIPLQSLPWDADTVRAAIDEIVSDALTHFKGERFWPAHPLDNGKDGSSSFYMGAAGMIWGLDYLRRVGGTIAGIDFGPVLARLRFSSRETLDGERSRAAAIWRTDWPAW